MLNGDPEYAGGRSIGRWHEGQPDKSLIFVWPRPGSDPALLPPDRERAAIAEQLEDCLDQVWRCERSARQSSSR